MIAHDEPQINLYFYGFVALINTEHTEFHRYHRDALCGLDDKAFNSTF